MADTLVSLTQALFCAQEAALSARKFLQNFVTNESISTTVKADGSPVTRADTTAQAIILKTLQTNFPTIPIVAEEEVTTAVSLHSSEYCWFVDPLDGTKEFIKGSKEFTINIALTHRGIPVIGVIDIPLWNEQYYAVEGLGSFWKTATNEQKITVSDHSVESARWVVSKDHVSVSQKRFMDLLDVKNPDSIGSSIKGCYVAAGKADVYLRLVPFWYWDVCAQDCIVRQAGGKCTLFDGSDIIYNHAAETVPGIVITNSAAHSEIIKQLAAFGSHQQLP